MTEAKQFVVVRGIDWRPPGKTAEVRAEPGDVLKASDLGERARKAFLKQGAIREA